MAIDDLVNKGKEFIEQNKDKVEEVLKSEEAESISDKILDGVSDAAKKVLGEEHHAKIDEVRDTIDKAVGSE